MRHVTVTFGNSYFSALESAEENARRLTGRPQLQLPHPECCVTKKEIQVPCDECDVGVFFNCLNQHCRIMTSYMICDGIKYNIVTLQREINHESVI